MLHIGVKRQDSGLPTHLTLTSMAKSSKRKSGQDSAETSETMKKNTCVKMKRTRKSMPRESPQQRSSIYRGVTRHRWTGRYEAHLWDKNCWNESQNKKGRQVYLGAYDHEEAAAHAYDLAALKYWGHETTLNFQLDTYENEVKEMEGQSREEYIGSLRRKSSGFSRGVSKYRGVARHHHNGRWEARIGRVFGNKYLYLGTYATQEEAAIAYDMAAVEYRGLNAVTNFDLSRYIKWIKTLSDTSSTTTTTHTKTNTKQLQNPNQQYNHNGDSSSTTEETTAPSPPPTSSALGLLIQSSKFKEILMEQTAAICSPSSSSEPEPPRRCFPDDIQTSFDFEDSSSFADEHDIIFGNYDSFVSAIFPCELDA